MKIICKGTLFTHWVIAGTQDAKWISLDPYNNKLASPVAQLMCPKMLVDPFVYRGCPYFFTTPMSAPFSIAS